MFSTCSELTPRAPIPDGRIEKIMQPCLEELQYIVLSQWCMIIELERKCEGFTGFVHLLEHMGDPWSDPYPEYRSLIECVYIMWVQSLQLKYKFMKSVTMAFQLNIPTQKTLKVRDSWLWRVLSGRLCGQGFCLPLHDGLSWHGLIGSPWGKHWGQQWRTKRTILILTRWSTSCWQNQSSQFLTSPRTDLSLWWVLIA